MKRIIAAVVALGVTFAFAQSSSAQPTPSGSDLFVVPQQTATAGGMVVVLKSALSQCSGPVTSTGFVAPIEFTHQDADGSWIGFGEAVGTPGTYSVSANCAGHLVERTFTAGTPR